MKLIHLSDLHLGKRVNEVSMLEDQKEILAQILQIVEEEQPDGVMICGDVYDKTVPSGEAVTLLDDFLWRLAEKQVPVMIISGNHDSPERLAFGNRMMEQSGIHISSVYQGKVESVSLRDEFGAVTFWLLPFVKPAHVRRFFPEREIESYTDAVRVALEGVELGEGKRNVLLTHQFVTGAATCESEELQVGGSDNVDVSIFEGFDYVALGHIHGPQNIGSNGIRYCGTPLKYSFSEERHHKSVTVVELGEKGQRFLRLRPLVPRRDLRTVRGSFAQVTARETYESTTREDYLHIVLTDEEDVPEAVGKLRGIYPNLMKVSYDNTRTRTNRVISQGPTVVERSPLELFEELYELQNNQPMTEPQRQFTKELMETIWEETP